MVIYLLSFILCGIMLPFFGDANSNMMIPLILNWKTVTVALGVVLIEIGFLMAYRVGGSIQWSGIAVNGTAALLLIPIGVLIFKESFSFERLLGIVITVGGMYLLTKDTAPI